MCINPSSTDNITGEPSAQTSCSPPAPPPAPPAPPAPAPAPAPANNNGRCIIRVAAKSVMREFSFTTIHQFIFGKIGGFVALKYKECSMTLTLLALALSCCNVFLRFNDDFRAGYSELDPQSELEHSVFLNFTGFKKAPYMIMVVAESVDGGSMLRLNQFSTFREELQRGLNIKLNITEKSDNTSSIPERLDDLVSFSNEIQFLVIEDALNNPGPQVRLGYPIAALHGQFIVMSQAIYGYYNGTAQKLVYYFGIDGDSPYLDYIKKAELLWSEELQANNNTITRMRLFGDSVVNNEISTSAFGACPYFFVGSVLMILFVFITLQRYRKKVLSALFLSFWTIFCPILAGSCTMAVMSLLRVPVNCVMMITPLLVLGVGVDDAFIMIHFWYNSTEKDLNRRLRSLFVNVGPSVTLTSFTNIIAFLIGSFLSTPDLRLFCLSSALAFSLDWFLQLFLFSPNLIFAERIQKAGTVKQVPPENLMFGRSFVVVYVEWLRMVPNRFSLIMLLVTYWIISVYGGLSMEENFSPEKTFNSESFLAKSLSKNVEMFREHEIIRIFVNDMPKDLQTLKMRLNKVRKIPYLCRNYPLWIDIYEAEGYGGGASAVQDYFGNVTRFFLLHPEAVKDVQFKGPSSLEVERIALDICVTGFGTWRDRAMMLQNLREQLPEGFVVYMTDSAVLDLIVSSRENVVKSVVVTVTCMAFICLLFIPSITVSLPAIVSVASITVGVVGGLYAWGADLDTMVLVNVVMAVGLTVDFSAHISYRFSKCPNVHNSEEMAKVIEAVAIPSLEAALTTVILVAPLYFYSVYMYVTFAKTIFLIAGIGLIHTMVVVPLIVLLVR